MRDVPTICHQGKIVRDRYIVEALLGRGGSGAVYRVRDYRAKGNVFALKELIDPNAYQRERFAFECEVLKRLDHLALPRVYRVFADSRLQRCYLLMDYVDGLNLEQLRLRQPEQRFTPAQILKLLTPVVEAITYLHHQQPPIIHRDIKPANIIVSTEEGSTVLVDFGIAKAYERNATTTAVRHCSPGYGAPEQYTHGTDMRTDIYGLGATVYTLVTGVVPIDALYRLTRLGSKGIDPLEPADLLVSTLSARLVALLHRSLAINSAERFASVDEFWQELQRCVMEEETPSLLPPVLLSPQANEEQARVDEAQIHAFTVVHNQQEQRTTVLLQQQPPAPQRVFWLLGMLLLILLAFATGAASHLTMISGEKQERRPHPHAELAKTIVLPPRAPVLAVSSPRASPTFVYPPLAERYDGTMNDLSVMPLLNSTLSLAHIQQHGVFVSGSFNAGSGTPIAGSWHGTLSTASELQFTVETTRALLLFRGTVLSDGSITGSYCSVEHQQCNYVSGAYGKWVVYRALGLS